MSINDYLSVGRPECRSYCGGIGCWLLGSRWGFASTAEMDDGEGDLLQPTGDPFVFVSAKGSPHPL